MARQLFAGGVVQDPESLWILGRIVGAGRIQAGTYRLDHPLTPLELIGKMVRGEVLYEEMVF
ncbi:MAG TPA: aminodeoxychorismate lyase, partial [Usitatibacter sp.]|nr:aminodeoxychorismate lyase [Usitatibacter sp.]